MVARAVVEQERVRERSRALKNGANSTSQAGASAPKKRKGLLGFLRIAFALVLLGAVAYYVPWRDRLTYQTPAGTTSVAGEISGDWRADSIQFTVAKDERVPSDWPDAIETARASGESANVVRSTASAQLRIDWRPGMLRIFRELDLTGLIKAFCFMMTGSLIAIMRWQRLLRVAGCPMTYRKGFRLSFLGLFFNLIVPGLTGGDLVKAILVVRENPERRADALMSVIVDRGLGLVVLIGLACAVAWMPDSHFHQVRVPVLLTFSGILFGLWLFLAAWPRRLLGIEKLLAKLPQRERVQSLDRALRIYGAHPFEMLTAVVLSIANHSCLAYGLFVLGRAFGDHQLIYLDYLGVASIANTISSIPIAPGGWGVGEAAYASLFHMLSAPTTLGIAVSVTSRLLSMVMGLAGGLFLLLPSGRNVRAEIQADSTTSG